MLLLVIMMPFVMADVDVDTVINVENGDLDYSSTIMTSGNVESNINAIVNGDLVLSTMFHETDNAYMNVDIDMNPSYYNTFTATTINQGGGESGLTIKYLKNNIKAVIDFLVDGDSVIPYRQEALEIVYHLSRFFATKSEMNTMYQNEMLLHYRILAIERTLEKIAPDEFCESKLEVMRDYNLPGATCGDWTYSVSDGYNGNDWIIGIKNVPLPEPEPEPDEPELETVWHPTEEEAEMLEVWDRMCDAGLARWCVIAETNRQSWGIE